jgi:hypothetical protein
MSEIAAYADSVGVDAISVLPTINEAITAKRATVRALINYDTPVLEDMREKVEAGLADVDVATARKLLNVVDQVVGSIERHSQMRGDMSGTAKNGLRQIDELLKLLAELADLPTPRGSHYTYWDTLYGGRQLTHGGTAGEVAFGEAVRGLDADQRQNALVTLGPIVDGSLALGSKDAIERLIAAAEVEDRIRNRMLFLWQRDESGERHLRVKTFTVDMRTCLVGFYVDGVLYSGPNAADVCGQVLYDLCLGVHNGDYKTKIVLGRYARMDTKDRTLVDAALGNEHSVFSRVLDAIPLTELELGSFSPQMSAGYLERLPQDTIAALEAFVALVGVGGKIWGTHQSQINTYLTNAHKEVSAEELENLPVPPTVGTGGHTHTETEALMRMRARNGLVKCLKDALDALKARRQAS